MSELTLIERIDFRFLHSSFWFLFRRWGWGVSHLWDERLVGSCVISLMNPWSLFKFTVIWRRIERRAKGAVLFIKLHWLWARRVNCQCDFTLWTLLYIWIGIESVIRFLLSSLPNRFPRLKTSDLTLVRHCWEDLAILHLPIELLKKKRPGKLCINTFRSCSWSIRALIIKEGRYETCSLLLNLLLSLIFVHWFCNWICFW